MIIQPPYLTKVALGVGILTLIGPWITLIMIDRKNSEGFYNENQDYSNCIYPIMATLFIIFVGILVTSYSLVKEMAD